MGVESKAGLHTGQDSGPGQHSKISPGMGSFSELTLLAHWLLGVHSSPANRQGLGLLFPRSLRGRQEKTLSQKKGWEAGQREICTESHEGLAGLSSTMLSPTVNLGSPITL